MITNKDKAEIEAHYTEAFASSNAQHDGFDEWFKKSGFFANNLYEARAAWTARSAEIATLKAKIENARRALLSTQRLVEENNESLPVILKVQDAGISIALTKLQ